MADIADCRAYLANINQSVPSLGKLFDRRSLGDTSDMSSRESIDTPSHCRPSFSVFSSRIIIVSGYYREVIVAIYCLYISYI